VIDEECFDTPFDFIYSFHIHDSVILYQNFVQYLLVMTMICIHTRIFQNKLCKSADTTCYSEMVNR